jgi:hypothetical protein
MSKSVLARTLTTRITVAALTTGILTLSVAAYAHGTGGQTGGGGPKGMTTMSTGKMTTTQTMNHNNHWRRLDFVGPGYVGPSYGCVYKRTTWGATRVCGDIY